MRRSLLPALSLDVLRVSLLPTIVAGLLLVGISGPADARPQSCLTGDAQFAANDRDQLLALRDLVEDPGRHFEKARRRRGLVAGEQRLDLAPERIIVVARIPKERRARIERLIRRVGEQLAHPLMVLRSHAGSSWSRS